MITEWNRGIAEEVAYDPTSWTKRIDPWKHLQLITLHRLLTLQWKTNQALEAIAKKYSRSK